MDGKKEAFQAPCGSEFFTKSTRSLGSRKWKTPSVQFLRDSQRMSWSDDD